MFGTWSDFILQNYFFWTGEGKAWQNMLTEDSISGNVGLGAYIRIDTLSQGDVFVSQLFFFL